MVKHVNTKTAIYAHHALCGEYGCDFEEYDYDKKAINRIKNHIRKTGHSVAVESCREWVLEEK